MSIAAKRAVELMGSIAETQRLFMALENLVQASARSPVCVAVLSSAVGEGKTLSAAALACAAAKQSAQRVLAIDFNWYRPALHEHFAVQRSFPVSRLTTPGALRHLAAPSGIAGLDILPAPLPYETEGQPASNPGGVVTHIIQEARLSYSTVIMDCPAVFPTNRYMVDPVSVARMADAVVLVVLAGVTARHEVKRTRVMLEMSESGRIGVVLNQWKNTLG